MKTPSARKPAAKKQPSSGSTFAHRNIPLLLLHAREQFVAHFRPILNAHGVTDQQWRIIRVLLDTGPLEPREISQRCRISSPSLVGVLVRMEEVGFITRKRVEHDQRRILVSLTAKSRTLAARMAPEIDASYSRIEQLVGRDYCERIYQMLDDVISVLHIE
jgi:homoprotocatechuate degradation regulator HpaR